MSSIEAQGTQQDALKKSPVLSAKEQARQKKSDEGFAAKQKNEDADKNSAEFEAAIEDNTPAAADATEQKTDELKQQEEQPEKDELKKQKDDQPEKDSAAEDDDANEEEEEPEKKGLFSRVTGLASGLASSAVNTVQNVAGKFTGTKPDDEKEEETEGQEGQQKKDDDDKEKSSPIIEEAIYDDSKPLKDHYDEKDISEEGESAEKPGIVSRIAGATTAVTGLATGVATTAFEKVSDMAHKFTGKGDDEEGPREREEMTDESLKKQEDEEKSQTKKKPQKEEKPVLQEPQKKESPQKKSRKQKAKKNAEKEEEEDVKHEEKGEGEAKQGLLSRASNAASGLATGVYEKAQNVAHKFSGGSNDEKPKELNDDDKEVEEEQKTGLLNKMKGAASTVATGVSDRVQGIVEKVPFVGRRAERKEDDQDGEEIESGEDEEEGEGVAENQEDIPADQRRPMRRQIVRHTQPLQSLTESKHQEPLTHEQKLQIESSQEQQDLLALNKKHQNNDPLHFPKHQHEQPSHNKRQHSPKPVYQEGFHRRN